eukprot:TRINITY_DN1862_c0_g5_i2.p2 TRINITY_DN1862_c0_g5~~TRINITY_DN1862_c0_g5_i2.p2  ORF type:complete len:168 (+),score=47.94 TRINITY_DN1862_c0_g5_i2:57-506(+)
MAMPRQQQDADMGLQLDMMAAAAMGPCKKEHRATLRDPNADGAFYDCLGQYSQEILPQWGSAERNGFTYYYQRGSNKTQWERPNVLQKVIQDGLETARKGTDYSPDRPWETCELLHVAHLMCLHRRAGRCDATQHAFVQCRKSRTGGSA